MESPWGVSDPNGRRLSTAGARVGAFGVGLAFAFDEAVATDVLLFHIGLQALIGFELLFEFEACIW